MVYIVKNYLLRKQIEKILTQNYDAFKRFAPLENTIQYVDKETGLTILKRINPEDVASVKEAIRKDQSVIFTVGLSDGKHTTK